MPVRTCVTAFSLSVQVVIEGFKSYKDQTIIEPFSENINVVGTPLHDTPLHVLGV